MFASLRMLHLLAEMALAGVQNKPSVGGLALEINDNSDKARIERVQAPPPVMEVQRRNNGQDKCRLQESSDQRLRSIRNNDLRCFLADFASELKSLATPYASHYADALL